jgi:hypothetical protein
MRSSLRLFLGAHGPTTALFTAIGLAGCGGDPMPDAGLDASGLDAPGLDAYSVDDAFVPGADAFVPPDAGADVTLTDDAGPTACLAPSTHVAGSDVLDHALGRATLTIEGDRDACLRRYSLASTGARRDMIPGSPRSFAERDGDPTLRTGHDLFDALFAMAMEESHEASVGSIQDYAFDMGAALPCPEGGCFETGRLWT